MIILLVFGVLVFIHELGHFLTARACGVTVNEFAIGMGPTIFSWRSKKNETKYALRLLPIGGFVSMQGENDINSEIPENDENAFCNKSVPKRMLITIAGAAMNLLLGFILMLILVFSTQNLGSTVVAEFAPNATSSEQLMVNDEIIKVGDTRVHTWNELAYEIMNVGYEPVDITVKRNGEKLVLEDVVFSTFEEKGTTFGSYDFIPYAEQANFGNLIKHTFFRSVSTVKMVLDSLKGLVTGRFGMEAVSGPIGVVTVVEDAAKLGFSSFLYVVCVLTINLGVFNLIPFPALDGGQFLFLAIEGVRGKPISRNVQSYINFVGIVILFAFMIFITCKDIISLI
ncbi:MAG: site-2 protease family protein [Clostridia bacterium]|nr:site-2 protease family protein [Clostridia bacterium]